MRTASSSPTPIGPVKAVPSDGLASLRRQWLREALIAAVLLGLATAGAGVLAGLSPWFAPQALALFGIAAWLVWRGLDDHPHRAFGGANRVTVLRLALTLGLAACLGEPVVGRPEVAWVFVVAATVAAVLDAADGPLARASGLASDFGARFDMETDAFLLLVLALLLVQLDKTGAWVLLCGLLRYAFVAAMSAWAWLARPLPPSLRRKTVCVVQIVVLIVGLGPIISRSFASTIAALGLAALLYSFAADVAWLARARHQPWKPSA
ncbi:MAG: CDP-alcohol phosphatidyltransferase family protein [Methylibium sp.]|uniref:CDP-alcohol phosphatidyltransferase family protein n=1 Tax=Methylibium sp. TaxID=2067992 RepID=UPI00178FEC9C|nr:CDP-alcohol phosphatidyltransferase family protein [Methylibium sp.]MBA3598433.1 CDP-alcohol phosphatidyltransferase family protein [Methylibium sp.]